MSLAEQPTEEYAALGEAVTGYFSNQRREKTLGPEEADVYIEHQDLVYAYAEAKAGEVQDEFGLFWLVDGYPRFLVEFSVFKGLHAAYTFMAEEGVFCQRDAEVTEMET